MFVNSHMLPRIAGFNVYRDLAFPVQAATQALIRFDEPAVDVLHNIKPTCLDNAIDREIHKQAQANHDQNEAEAHKTASRKVYGDIAGAIDAHIHANLVLLHNASHRRCTHTI